MIQERVVLPLGANGVAAVEEMDELGADRASSGERVSRSDLALKKRMEREETAAITYVQRLRAFVVQHFREEYGLRDGDEIEDDGRIVRILQPARGVSA